MKNKDLIAKLQQRDPEAEALHPDYKGQDLELMVYALEEGSAEWEYRCLDAEKILKELVDLKKTHDNPNASEQEKQMYKHTKAAVWEMAKEHLRVAGYPDQIRTCRVCGCTDYDCRQCIEKTGSPCHWVEPDLCSACVETGG